MGLKKAWWLKILFKFRPAVTGVDYEPMEGQEEQFWGHGVVLPVQKWVSQVINYPQTHPSSRCGSDQPPVWGKEVLLERVGQFGSRGTGFYLLHGPSRSSEFEAVNRVQWGCGISWNVSSIFGSNKGILPHNSHPLYLWVNIKFKEPFCNASATCVQLTILSIDWDDGSHELIVRCTHQLLPTRQWSVHACWRKFDADV
jgi:hypothetical protein